MAIIPETSTTLLRHLQSGSNGARWGAFIARYEPILRAYLQAHFPRVEADDVLQESFLALMQALPNFHYDPQGKGHFRNYLTGIVRRRALQFCREQDRHHALLKGYAQDPTVAHEKGSDSADELLSMALQELLGDASIAAQSKQVFMSVALHGEAPSAVAERFGITRNNVDQIKRRLTKRLQAKVAALEKLL